MKKFLFVIGLIALVVSGVSAQEGAAVEISGALKAQFGVDLDYSDTGFKYVADGLQIKIKPAVAEDEHIAGDVDGDGMYAEIGVNGIRLEADSGWGGMDSAHQEGPVNSGSTPATVDTDNDGIITVDEFDAALQAADADDSYGEDRVIMKWKAVWAKIVLGNLVIKLKDGPGLDINFAGANKYSWYLKNAYDYEVFDGQYGGTDISKAVALDWESWNNIYFDPTTANIGIDDIATNYKIQAQYTLPETAVISLDLGSTSDWTDNGATPNQYAFRLSADVQAVENLTLTAGGNFANYTGQYLGLGLKAGYKVALNDTDSVSPIAAVHYNTDAGNGDMSVSGGIDATVSGIHLTAYAGYSTDLEAAATTAVAYTVAADITTVENLILKGAYEVTPSTMAAHAKVGYSIVDGDKKITPSVQFSTDNPNTAATAIDYYLKGEIAFEGFLENSTFYLNYDSNDMSDASNTLGQVVFTTKVSF